MLLKVSLYSRRDRGNVNIRRYWLTSPTVGVVAVKLGVAMQVDVGGGSINGT